MAIIKKLWMLLALLICMQNFVWALEGGTDTHGGDGYIINDKYYLLDFVEFGVYKNPYFYQSEEKNEFIEKLMENNLTELDDQTHSDLVLKISDIYKISPPLAMSIVMSSAFYSLKFVDQTLIDVRDADYTVIFDSKNLVQLAIRRGIDIFINDQAWQKLDRVNKVALIIHEIVYAFSNNQKESNNVRSLIGHVFSQNFIRQGTIRLNMYLGGVNNSIAIGLLKDFKPKISYSLWFKENSIYLFPQYLEIRGPQDLVFKLDATSTLDQLKSFCMSSALAVDPIGQFIFHYSITYAKLRDDNSITIQDLIKDEDANVRTCVSKISQVAKYFYNNSL